MTAANEKREFLVWLFRFLGLLLITGLIASPYMVSAQEKSGSKDFGVDISRVAPVRMDARTIFMVAGTISFPASTRAAAIGERIREAATANWETDLVVEVRGDVFGWAIYAIDARIMAVTEIDAAIEDSGAQNAAMRCKGKRE